MSLSLKIALLRTRLADLPRLIGDVWRYARYRRLVYCDLEGRNRGIAPIECISLLDALRRIHDYRFPGRPWADHREIEMTIGEDNDSLETLYLALICRVAQPRAVFEIGTYEGRTANVIALHTAPECRILTLDLPPEGTSRTQLPVGASDKPWLDKEGTRVGKRLGTLPGPADNDRIQALFGDSATFDFSSYRGQIDLVFVDGAHSYEYVISDVGNALTMLAPRGFILMHDLLTHAGVTLAAMTLRRRHEIIHVAQTSYAVLFPGLRGE
jgi:predicted O-methyltransferase YrrM